MNKNFGLLSLLLSCLFTACSSGFMGALVSAQEWSANYARLEGTTCGSPEMIDGNLETIGTTWMPNFSEKKHKKHWIVVTLPIRKPIHRIVIRETNIEDVIIYENLGREGEWRRIKQIKNNSQPTIDLRVRAITNSIRFKVGGTFDDRHISGQYSYRTDSVRNRQIERGFPKAGEIELYGFRKKQHSSAK